MSDELEPMEDETPQTETQDQSPEGEDHPIKESLREGAAKVVSLAVEVGSLLSGESGDLVTAERELAEAETEEFLDRIDGEG